MKASLSNLKMKKAGNNKDASSLFSEWIGPKTSKEQAQVEDYGETSGGGTGGQQTDRAEINSVQGPEHYKMDFLYPVHRLYGYLLLPRAHLDRSRKLSDF